MAEIQRMSGRVRNTASVGAVVLAAGILLAGCTGRPDGAVPVTPFDIERYAGTWYEIMRLDHSFERGLTNVAATYSLNDDDTVDVINRGSIPTSVAGTTQHAWPSSRAAQTRRTSQ